MKSRLFVVFLLTNFLSCGYDPGTSADLGIAQAPEDGVIAYVNDEPLLKSEFEEYVQSTQGELSDDPSTPPLNQLFRDYLLRRLILQQAQSEGVAVSSEEINSYLEDRVLNRDSLEDQVVQEVRELLLIQRFLNRRIAPQVEVTLNELQTYYERNHEHFKVDDQAHVREILTDNLEEAEKLRSDLIESDIRKFKELAHLYSRGVTAKSGGDLGTFERGQLPEKFENVIFSLKPGEISQPVHSDYGYHLFLVEEWIPRHDQRFYEVQDEIFEKLVTEKERRELDKISNNLLKNASIEIREPRFQLNSEEIAIDETLLD